MAEPTDDDRQNDTVARKRDLIWKEAQGYAESRVTSKKLNKARAKSRGNIEEGGIRTDSFQDGIRLSKDLEPADLEQYLEDLQLVLSVLGARQGELFPEEVARRQKRAEQAKTKAEKKAAGGKTKKVSKGAAAAAESKGRNKAELDNKTDTDPASAPKIIKTSDGTGPNDGPREGETTDAFIKRQAQEKNAAAEQQAGEKVLNRKSGEPLIN